MRKLNLVLLFILPVLLFCFGILVKSEVGFYHLFTSDPAYAYLFNGLTICEFQIPWLVQGPGTTLEVFCAIVMWIVHLFRQHDTLMLDVMKNPDIYLSVINTSIIAIQCIVLFLMGIIIYQSTNSLLTGVFFQFTPFVSWIIIEILRLVMVENLIIIGVFCLIIVVFKYLKYQNDKEKLIDRYLIYFSIIIGFIACTKLMYLPIAIIPFLLLPGYKKKLIYVFFSIIAFFIFSYNVFYNWVYIRDYYINNFMHSGQYGQGPATIIDLNTFPVNLKNLFTSDGIYLKAFLIIMISVLIYPLPFLKVKEKNDKSYKALLGIAITMTIMSLLVAKQFKYYYMTSALLLIIPGLYLVFVIYTRPVSKRRKILIYLPLILILVFFMFNEVMTILKNYPYYMDKKETYLKTMKYVKDNFDDQQPTLVIPNYYGTPYKEYGLFYGMAWSGNEMRLKYAVELNRLYPNIYFYHSWNNLFNQWDNCYSYIDLIEKYHHIVLFSGDKELEQSLSGKILGLNRQYDTKVWKIIFFESTGETIYAVSYDSTLKFQPQSYYFNAELLDTTEQYFINKEGLKCGNGNTRSSDFARSGRYSSKLSNEAPYGMTGYLSEVDKDEHFRISIWRYNNMNKNAGLVIASGNSNDYYNFNTQPSEEEKQWQKIEIDLVVPEIMHMKDLKIYCWNSDTTLPAYFDDLLIEKEAQ
jgi:hypothetical protein